MIRTRSGHKPRPETQFPEQASKIAFHQLKAYHSERNIPPPPALEGTLETGAGPRLLQRKGGAQSHLQILTLNLLYSSPLANAPMAWPCLPRKVQQVRGCRRLVCFWQNELIIVGPLHPTKFMLVGER